jgi:hypothetical protein
MLTCASCQEQLLDYVYGLYDEAGDAQLLSELRQHLESCANCQAALTKVKEQQGLLAEASRVSTNITFTKPQVEVKQYRHRQTTTTVWYATVAGLLVAMLAGLSGMYYWGQENRWKPVELAQAELTQAIQRQDETQKNVELEKLRASTTRQDITRKEADLKALEEAKRTELLAKANYQEIIAQQSVLANNDAHFSVRNSTLLGQPAPLSEVDVNLKDAQQQESLNQLYRNRSNSDKFNFTLPSVAYSDKAGQVFNNEILPDVSNNPLASRLKHPIQIQPTEYFAHLCTDKPIYQPGEEVFFRGIALEKTTLSLPKEDLFFDITLNGPDKKQLYKTSRKAQLQKPGSEDLVRDATGRILQAVGADSFKLPENISLGEATLTLTEKNNRFDTQTVRLTINNITQPHFNKQLAFTKTSFVPGEKATLTGTIKLPTQQPWGNSNFTYQILIDGQQFDAKGQRSSDRQSSSTDASGNVKLEFTIPKDVTTGQGTLAVQLKNGNTTETWTQPFRIETGQLRVDCYPEGGDLIAGVPNHVYFQVRNQAGEAVDGEGQLLDSAGKPVQTFRTFSDETEAKASRGMGRFSFTPQLNETYRIRMTRPADTQVNLQLPAARPTGVAMHAKKSLLMAGEPLQLELSNQGQPRELVISVYCREVMIALDRVTMSANITQTILVDSVKPLGGVYRVNVAEKRSVNNRTEFVPLAERLVYRHPAQYLSLNLSSVETVGKPTQLVIESKNEKQEATPGYLTIVGVNKSLLQMAEASTLRRLPAHFYLAQEVRQPEELEFADFFLSTHPAASEALDLLLGVQGYRRFIANPVETSYFLQQEQKAQQNPSVDPLPLTSFDNRREVLEQAIAEAKKAARDSKLAEELRQLKTSYEESQVALNRFSEGEEKPGRVDRIPQLTTALEDRKASWEKYTFWFHMISSGLMALLALAALVALALRRSLLPTHLMVTLGCLGTLGLAGASWLWWKQQPIEQKVAVAGQAMTPVEMKTLEKAAGPSSTPNLPEVKMAPSTAPASAGVAKAEAPAKLSAQAEQSESWPEKKTSDREVPKAMAMGKEQGEGAKDKADSAPKDSLEKENIVPEKMAKQSTMSDKLKEATSNDESLKRERLQTPGTGAMQNNYNPQYQRGSRNNDLNFNPSRRQTDNRTQQLALSQETVNQRQMERNKSEATSSGKNNDVKNSVDKGTVTEPMPGGMGGMGGGMGGSKGMPPPAMQPRGSKGGDSAAPASTPAPPVVRMQAAVRDEPGVFYARVYSWGLGQKPLALSKAKPAWSQTVYWNPLVVTPSSGKLIIPIDLPADASVYQFDVFGHDGAGRLGAKSIDIKSPSLSQSQKPIHLKTELSHGKARIGDVVQLKCRLENRSTRKQPEVIARLILPEGLSLPQNLNQLKRAIRTTAGGAYQDPVRFDIKGQELKLTWSELATEQELNFAIELICQKEGRHEARPSLAYLLNQQHDASQSPGLLIEITP